MTAETESECVRVFASKEYLDAHKADLHYDGYARTIVLRAALPVSPAPPPPSREALAEYAHRAWSGWMNYLFGKSKGNADGTVTIPASLVERWLRQSQAQYADLPEAEKESDRTEADRILALVQPVPDSAGEAVAFKHPAGNEAIAQWITKAHHLDGCSHREGRDCNCGKAWLEAGWLL